MKYFSFFQVQLNLSEFYLYFGIFQDQTQISSQGFIECYQENQIAGKYNISEHLYPGYSQSY